MSPSHTSESGGSTALLGGLMPPTDPPADVDYSHQLATPAIPRLMLAVAGLLGLAGFTLLPVLVASVVYGLSWLLRGKPVSFGYYVTEQANSFRVPEGVLGAQLGLAVLIPVVLLVLWTVLGLHPRWVCSVQPGMRWQLMLWCFLGSLAVLVASVWVSQLRHAGAPHPQEGFWWFALVLVVCTPFQAAAEEFFFRGLMLTVLGGMLRNTPVTVLLSAFLFASVHGTQNVPMFLDRFAFGVLAGWLVVTTGGLEAAIAAHIANNLIAFGAAGLWSSISAARTATAVTWTQAGIDVATFSVVALVCVALGRLMHVENRTPGVAG